MTDAGDRTPPGGPLQARLAMLERLRTSGDPVIDRRLEWAAAMLEEGDATGAAALLAETALMAPEWPTVWVRLGDAYAADGAPEAAGEAYRIAVEKDPGDTLGAGLKRARLGIGAPPAAPPPDHIGTLFDSYAPRFEELLLGTLGYRAPALLAARIAAAHPGPDPRFAAALDLGCGTGLAGIAVRPWCARLVGLDLSPAMLAEAERKGVYDALYVGEAVAALARGGPHALPDGSFDLILAADVLCYLGDLAPLFAALAGRLSPGGLVAVTTERADPGEAAAGWVLRDSLRYAHDPAHVVALAADVGLGTVSADAEILRQDRGAPIEGTVFMFSALDADSRRP